MSTQGKASRRAAKTRSFKVMDVVQRADQLARAGRTIYHLEVGQPQSSAPQIAIRTAQEQLGKDRCGYTSARGEVPLREALAAMYSTNYGVTVSPQRIHVAPGSSGAFTIAFHAAFDVGDAVAVPSTSYPCYTNLLSTYGCEVVPIAIDKNYNVTAKELAECQQSRKESGLPPVRGLILSSPANPTGAMLTPEELSELCALCDRTGVQFISDEIYHGISFEGAPRAACALEFTKNAIIINSFSKYYSMTGWRLGWLVVPDHLDSVVDALNQNMNVSAPTIAQRAAVAALSAEAKVELEEHVKKYAANRQVVIEGLREMGIEDYAPPHGAFYMYVDLARHGVRDSAALCEALITEAGVALTPGIDFEQPGSGLGEQRFRIGFPGSTEEVREAMKRLRVWWESESGQKHRCADSIGKKRKTDS
eukprot:TRINITY_DN80831_c0_g1_i1.p1 TRINITY_DN80831_c0_g1~~TRINITY_DN80831_c0_g1_i1.p1  ORF type:complete len:421 (+),score=85.18 TRINITY_DN80831_c0_g1_i1:56-1318(+)